jgi:predicted N-acyltransferase
VPQATYSLHYLAHPGLARAVGDYLEHKRREVAGDQAHLARHAPFRHDDEQDF